MTTETCGFYNTAGFNDDTRAFLLYPGPRHDVARRSDCAYLANPRPHGAPEGGRGFRGLPLDLTPYACEEAYRL